MLSPSRLHVPSWMGMKVTLPPTIMEDGGGLSQRKVVSNTLLSACIEAGCVFLRRTRPQQTQVLFLAFENPQENGYQLQERNHTQWDGDDRHSLPEAAAALQGPLVAPMPGAGSLPTKTAEVEQLGGWNMFLGFFWFCSFLGGCQKDSFFHHTLGKKNRESSKTLQSAIIPQFLMPALKLTDKLTSSLWLLSADVKTLASAVSCLVARVQRAKESEGLLDRRPNLKLPQNSGWLMTLVIARPGFVRPANTCLPGAQ